MEKLIKKLHQRGTKAYHAVPLFQLCCFFFFISLFTLLFSATGEQFVLVSLDNLHHIHGELKESECGEDN